MGGRPGIPRRGKGDRVACVLLLLACVAAVLASGCRQGHGAPDSGVDGEDGAAGDAGDGDTGDGNAGDGEPGAIGSACSEDADCRGGFCLPWTGGYCTSRCQRQEDCPAGSVCATDPVSRSETYCLLGCQEPSDCRKWYGCMEVFDPPGKVCASYFQNGTRGVGEPCLFDEQCSGMKCLVEGYPGGACSFECDPDGCPDCASCVAGSCMLNCSSQQDCGREGYLCVEGICKPDLPSGTKERGELCGSDLECRTGFCLTHDPNLGDGLCSFPCRQDGDCLSDEYCISAHYMNINEGYCLKKCSSDTDCAENIGCRLWSDSDHPGWINICYARDGAGTFGAPCLRHGDCADGLCLIDGWYCSILCGDGHLCPGNQPCLGNICYQSCTVDADCRSAGSPACREILPGAWVCVSGGGGSGVGEPCGDFEDCEFDPAEPYNVDCILEDLGGYCTKMCDPSGMLGTCPTGTRCVVDPGNPMVGYCFVECSASAPCRRAGFGCVDGTCKPQRDFAGGPGGGGTPCRANAECAGFCRNLEEPWTNSALGLRTHSFCSQVCSQGVLCSQGEFCVPDDLVPTIGSCRVTCATSSDCPYWSEDCDFSSDLCVTVAGVSLCN